MAEPTDPTAVDLTPHRRPWEPKEGEEEKRIYTSLPDAGKAYDAYVEERIRLRQERPAELLERVPPLLRSEAADALLPSTPAPPRAERGRGAGEGVPLPAPDLQPEEKAPQSVADQFVATWKKQFEEDLKTGAPLPLPEQAGKTLLAGGTQAVGTEDLRKAIQTGEVSQEEKEDIKALEQSYGLGEVPEGLTPIEKGTYRDLIEIRRRTAEMAAQSPAFRRALESGELSLVEKKEPTLAAGARKTISSFLGTDEPPDVLTQVAAGDPIAWSKLTGKAIPWGTWYNTLFLEHKKDLENRYREENKDRGGLHAMTQPEYAALEEMAKDYARRELKSISTTISGLVFLDRGQGQLEDIMKKPSWLRVPTALASPPGQYQGGMVGRASFSRRPYDALLRSAVVSEGLAAMLKHSAPEGAADIPGWISREYDDPDTVRAAYYGEANIFDFVEPIGAGIVGEDASRGAKLAAGLGVTVPIVLLEPDAVSIPLIPFGVAGKLAVGGARAVRLLRTSKLLQKSAKRIRAGESVGTVLGDLDNADPILAQVLRQHVGTMVGKKGSLKDMLQSAHKAELRAADVAKKKRLEAQDLLDGAAANKAEYEALEAESHALDMRVKQEELLAQHLERQRDALLELLPSEGEGALKSRVYNWNTFQRRMDKAIQAENQKIDAIRQSRQEAFKASENVDKLYENLVTGVGLRAPGSSLDDGRVVLDIDFGPKAPVYKLDDGTELSSGVEIKAAHRKTLGETRGMSERWKKELREPRNEIAIHQKIIQDLTHYRDGRGGVQDAIDAAREARKGVAEAVKTRSLWASTNSAKLKELRVPHKKASQALKAAQEAAEKATKEGNLTEALLKSLDELSDQTASHAKTLSKDLPKRALTDTFGDIQQYGFRVSDKEVQGQFAKILKEGTKVDQVTKEMGMEGEKLARTILKVLRSEKAGDSEAIFARYLQSPEGRPLAAALSAPGAKIYAPQAGAEIQRSLLGLVEEVHKSRVFTGGDTWAKAYTQALQDSTFGIQRGSQLVLQFIQNEAKAVRQIPRRIGDVSEEIEDLVRAADNLLAMGSREALEHFQTIKGLRGVDEIISWLDDPEPARGEKLGGVLRDPKLGVSIFDETTGPGSKWEKARRNIIDDSRIDPAKMEQARAEALEVKTKLLAQLDEIIKTNAMSDDAADSLRKLLTETDDADMVVAGKLLQDPEAAAREVAPVAVLSLARMWFPGFENLPNESAALMVGLVRKIARDSTTYRDFQQRMLDTTKAVLGGADDSPGGIARSHAMATTAVLHAAVLDHMARGMAKILGPHLSPETVADMNNLMSGNYHRVKDAEAAQEALLALGMPVTQQTLAKAAPTVGNIKQVTKESRLFVQMGVEGSGQAVFTPRNIMKDIDSQTRNIVKSLEPTNIKPLSGGGVIHYTATGIQGVMSLWRQSILSGTILPNARYWTNNMAGDMSQIWLEEGLVRAGRLSAMNSISHLPFFGRRLQEGLYNLIYAGVEKGKKVRKGTRFEILPSITEAYTNPVLGRIFAGRDGFVVTKNNEIIELSRLRAEAAEDGILISQITEEMTDAYTRVAQVAGWKQKIPYYFKWWNRQMADHADMTQQRMRMSLYTGLRQEGVSRKEAKRRTMNALYDWKHGTVELLGVSAVTPFWRFWKLAQRQIMRTLTDPLTRPATEQLGRALTGRSGLARVRQQAALQEGLPRILSEEEQEYIHSEAAEIRELLSYLYPKWLQPRVLLGIRRASEQRREYHLQEQGKDISSVAYVMPSTTILDTWQIVYGMMSGLRMVAATVSRSRGGAPVDLPANLEAELFEPALSRLWGPFEVAARAGIGTLGFDLDYEPGRGGSRFIKPEELAFLQLVEGISGSKLYSIDPSSGRGTTSTKTYLILRSLPGLATASDYAKAGVFSFENPGFEESTAKGISYMVRQLTRVGHEVEYSGEREAEALQTAMTRKFGERELAKVRDLPEQEAAEAGKRFVEGRSYSREDLTKLPPED